jgi:hypothetical protein
MKKAILLFILCGLFATVNAQVKFFNPVPDNLFKEPVSGAKAIENPSVWLFRPVATVTAIQLNWNKATKSFDATALSSAGLGVSYAHFIESNGLPYNNFSVNALLLLGASLETPEPASVSLALTGSFMNFISVGGLYNFGSKSFGILTGVAIKF